MTRVRQRTAIQPGKDRGAASCHQGRNADANVMRRESCQTQKTTCLLEGCLSRNKGPWKPSASTPTNEGPPRPVVAGLRSGGPRGAVVLRRRDQLAPPRAPRRTSWHLLELIALHPTAEVARPVGRSVGEGAPNAQPPHAREKEPSKVTRSPGADLRPHHPSRAVRLREPHGAPPAGGPLRPVPELVRPGLPRGHHRVPDGQGPGAGGRRGPDCG
ncbi:proline-rich proteoglycan 2 isoform X1 [Sus scrofa]|uniref:proline-rich proteoglycan 2 isoform X1 n=1 Tax=Sus scrofa TaxID=9823 RepID=UPI0001E88CC2|nr:proline-rich proteoglycan 2 isoform X1 [Sus scrofa]